LKWFWLSGAILVLDQVSKLLAENLLVMYEPVRLLPLLNLAKAYNTGAAFSFLSDASGWQRWFFIALAVFVIGVLATWLRRLATDQGRLALALSLILGGAAGNLVDRVAYGHVIDFIDFYYGSWHWPTFNIADSAITVGAILWVLDSLLTRRAPASG